MFTYRAYLSCDKQHFECSTVTCGYHIGQGNSRFYLSNLLFHHHTDLTTETLLNSMKQLFPSLIFLKNFQKILTKLFSHIKVIINHLVPKNPINYVNWNYIKCSYYFGFFIFLIYCAHSNQIFNQSKYLPLFHLATKLYLFSNSN